MFVDVAKQYAVTTDTKYFKPTTTASQTIYGKKCFVINIVTKAGDMSHSSAQSLKFVCRPDGSSVVKSLSYQDVTYGSDSNANTPNVHSICKFVASLSASWTATITSSSGTGDAVYALVIPCE